MKVEPRIVFWTLGCALGFGCLAQWLLGADSIGLNLGVLAGVAAAMLGVMSWKKIFEQDVSVLFLIAPILNSGYAFAVPDSRNLVELNGVVGFLSVSYYALRVSARRPLSLTEVIFKPSFIGFMMPFAGILTVFMGDWKKLTPKDSRFRSRGVMIGIILALPVLLVFGAILSQADPMFQKLFEFKFDINPDEAIRHMVTLGAAAAAFAGLIIYLSQPMYAWLMHQMSPSNTYRPPEIQGPPPPPATPREAQEADHVAIFHTFFGLISLLFVAFILIQIKYLFGGDSVVLRTAGLTYAAYAKRGFLEIAIVEALCLPLLVAGQYLLRNNDTKIRRGVNLQIVIVVGLLFLLMASAAFRLKLYVDAYGLTPLRFYVAAGMVWLACLLVAALIYGIRWQLDRLGRFLYSSMVCITLGVNAVKPDYWIARVNLTRKEVQGLDPEMITAAGADAYPAIIQFGGKTRTAPGQTRPLLDGFLDNQRRRSHDWRDMTVSQYMLPKS